MAKPIGPKFCVGHYMTPGKGYVWSEFKNPTIYPIKMHNKYVYIESKDMLILKPESKFYEFEQRLKSGLNLETLNTILSGTNYS